MKINGLSPELAKRLLHDKGYMTFTKEYNKMLKDDGLKEEFPTGKELRAIIKDKIKQRGRK
jgi:hypothetical protein